jgi:hypothetical protein
MSKINPLGLLDEDRAAPAGQPAGVNPLGLSGGEREYVSHGPRKHRPVESEAVSVRASSASASQLGRALAGGRVSIDRSDDAFFGNTLANFVTHSNEQNLFRAERFDARALARMPVARLMELLADNSPEVSRALWDLLLFCNPGWKAQALKPGTEDVDKAGQAALDEFLSSLHGPFAAPHVMPADVVIASMFMTVGMRGSILAELVLDDAGRLPLEIATPDPATLEFRRAQDPARGRVWVVGQRQGSEFVPLDRETVVYVPVHPFPGSPHGRSLFAPAVFSSLFLLGMLYDIKRVVQQQGYPRLDIAIDFEKLRTIITDEVLNDVDKYNEVVDQITAQVTKHYSSLEPDDAYVHSTIVEVKQPVGAVDARSLGAVEGLIRALERMCVRALKSMPLLFGLTETASETHANREWEIHVAGIKSIQHMVEFVLERLCGLGLRARGIAAVVKFRFSELRAAEMLRDAQTEKLRMDNAVRKRDEGLITQDECSVEVTGKPAAFPGPVRTSSTSGGGTVPAGSVQADPGSER